MLEYYESGAIPDIDNAIAVRLTYARQRVIVDKQDINWGVEAVYVPVNAKRGLKLYRSIKDGKLARECQEEAAGFELGPEVLSPLCEFIFPVGTKIYAPIIADRFQTGKAYGYYTQLADTKRVPLDITESVQFELLRADCMEKLSFGIGDFHSTNVGFIDNRLVVIDFGWHTTGNPTQRKLGHFSIEIKHDSKQLCAYELQA